MTSLASLLKHSRPQKTTFEEWLKQVDISLASRCGLSMADLPDCCYRDWYEDGVSPSRAAGRAMRASNGY